MFIYVALECATNSTC